MSQRLDPIGKLALFQNQTNHYKNIVKPRKAGGYLQGLDKEGSRYRTCSSYGDSKFQKQKRQSIKRQNQRMFKDFVQIQRKQGILQRVELQFRTIKSQQNRRASLVNPFKLRQEEDRIKKQNQFLAKKMYDLKSSIGDRQQWKKHSQFTNNIVNKLRNKSQQTTLKAEDILNVLINKDRQKGNGILKLYQTLVLDKRQSVAQQDSKAMTLTGRQTRGKRNRQTKHTQALIG